MTTAEAEAVEDSLADSPERRLLLTEALHATSREDEETAALHPDGVEGEDSAGGRCVCLNPNCGKPTWNGEPGEFCSIDCRDLLPPICKRPGCWKNRPQGHDDEYCSMGCKNICTLCLKPGCTKQAWNGRPKNFCGLACYGEAEAKCMMIGCGKPTWNGMPAGFCTPEHRDEARALTIKTSQKKSGTAVELDKHITRMVQQRFQRMSKVEQESIKAKQEYAKSMLMEAESSKDLLLRADIYINSGWIREVEVLPGNIYSIGAFGRMADYRAEEAHKTMGRVLGWFLVWLLQIVGPPAMYGSTLFAFGIKKDMQFHWWDWEVDFYDWRHVALTKFLALIFQVCFVLNGLYVIMEERDAWHKIYAIYRYMRHYNTAMVFPNRFFLYLGAITNCWVVLWCCADTVVVFGAAQSPKDVIFDSLGLLFLYNLDDIGGELGFVTEGDWPAARLGWIYSEMVARNWHAEEGTTRKKEEFDEEDIGRPGRFVLLTFRLTKWTLCLALVLYPVFNAITPWLKIAPPDGGWPEKPSTS